MSHFQPPRDWDAVYAASPDYFFGDEPSQIARAALHGFQLFGGQPGGALALDLGCGEGRDTAFFAEAGFQVIARDIAPTGLEKTRALLAQRQVSLERVDLALEDARAFVYPQEAYEVALAANVYQFLPPEEVRGHIERLKAATKPGGICAVGVFSPAMAGWGADIAGFYTATAEELMAYFPTDGGGWLPLDRTDYWTYRPQEKMMASFAYVVARKQITE